MKKLDHSFLLLVDYVYSTLKDNPDFQELNLSYLIAEDGFYQFDYSDVLMDLKREFSYLRESTKHYPAEIKKFLTQLNELFKPMYWDNSLLNEKGVYLIKTILKTFFKEKVVNKNNLLSNNKSLIKINEGISSPSNYFDEIEEKILNHKKRTIKIYRSSDDVYCGFLLNKELFITI